MAEQSGRHEVAAGGVVVRRVHGLLEVCLIRRTRHAGEAWSLPKGHLEPGEDAATAALREVREETGVVGEILEPLGTIRYQVRRSPDAAAVSKTVHFFLMRALDHAPRDRDDGEVAEVRWIPLDQAIADASYENEREVLRNARAPAERHPILQRSAP